MSSSILNKKSIKFKILSFIVNLILLCNITFYHIVSVYAMADPSPSISSSSLWTVIDGGASDFVETLIQNPILVFMELQNSLALGAVAHEAYWDNVNAEINKKINDGTLSASDVGVVWYKEVDGQQIPYAIVSSSFYGCNEYLLTNELAQKIIDEQLETDAEIQEAVNEYWESVVISDVQPFISLANNIDNWVVSFTGTTNSILQDTINFYSGFFNGSTADGATNVNIEFPSAKNWCDTYNSYSYLSSLNVYGYNEDNYYYCICRYPNPSVADKISARILRIDKNTFAGRFEFSGSNVVNQDDGPSTSNKNTYYLNPCYRNFDITGSIYGVNKNFNLTSEEVYNLLGLDPDFLPNPDYWFQPLIVLAPDLAPLRTPGVNYNVGDVADFDDALALEAQNVLDLNPEPITYPVLDPNVYPNQPDGHTWDEIIPRDYPVPNPGDTPGGGDGGDEPPGGDDSDDSKPGERPKLKVPMLLTLFPFCIPFDIKKAIQLFSADGSNPVFNVPIHIEYGGHVIVDYTFVLDLTSYGISSAVGYIKAVEVVAYIIVLCWATSKVIF